jgi:hypothetical protein
MDQETRARAEEKLQEMDQYIAYHGKYFDLSLLCVFNQDITSVNDNGSYGWNKTGLDKFFHIHRCRCVLE